VTFDALLLDTKPKRTPFYSRCLAHPADLLATQWMKNRDMEVELKPKQAHITSNNYIANNGARASASPGHTIGRMVPARAGLARSISPKRALVRELPQRGSLVFYRRGALKDLFVLIELYPGNYKRNLYIKFRLKPIYTYMTHKPLLGA